MPDGRVCGVAAFLRVCSCLVVEPLMPTPRAVLPVFALLTRAAAHVGLMVSIGAALRSLGPPRRAERPAGEGPACTQFVSPPSFSSHTFQHLQRFGLPAPLVKHVAFAPVVNYAAPAPTVAVAPAPVVVFIAPAPASSYAAPPLPVQNFQSRTGTVWRNTTSAFSCASLTSWTSSVHLLRPRAQRWFSLPPQMRQNSWKALMYPVLISPLGIAVGVVSLVLQTVICKCRMVLVPWRKLSKVFSLCSKLSLDLWVGSSFIALSSRVDTRSWPMSELHCASSNRTPTLVVEYNFPPPAVFAAPALVMEHISPALQCMPHQLSWWSTSLLRQR